MAQWGTHWVARGAWESSRLEHCVICLPGGTGLVLSVDRPHVGNSQLCDEDMRSCQYRYASARAWSFCTVWLSTAKHKPPRSCIWLHHKFFAAPWRSDSSPNRETMSCDRCHVPARRPKSWRMLATTIASHTYFSLLVSEKTRQRFRSILTCVARVTNPKFHSDYRFQEQCKAPRCTCF